MTFASTRFHFEALLPSTTTSLSLVTAKDAIQSAIDILDLIAFAAEGLEDRSSALTAGCNAARDRLDYAMEVIGSVNSE